MSDPRETTLHALENARGDDLARARHAFRGLTPQRMGEQYGESGKTRAEIVAGYEAHEREIDAAIAWVRSRP